MTGEAAGVRVMRDPGRVAFPAPAPIPKAVHGWAMLCA